MGVHQASGRSPPCARLFQEYTREFDLHRIYTYSQTTGSTHARTDISETEYRISIQLDITQNDADESEPRMAGPVAPSSNCCR